MKIRSLLSMLILILVITSCKAAVINKPAPVVEELQGKITIWTIPDCSSSLKLAAANFKNKNPKVQIDIVSYDSNVINTKLNEKLLSASKDVDLLVLDNANISEILNDYPNSFMEVSSYISGIKAGFPKNVLNSVTVKNKIMAFPWYEDVAALYYRKDIFDKSDIDVRTIKTWDEYIAAGEKIKITNSSAKLLGINEKNGDDFFRILLNQLRSGYIGTDGKSLLSSEDASKAMTLIKRFHDLQLDYNYSDNTTLISQINNNSIISMPTGATFSQTLEKFCPDLKKKWAVMKLPAFEAGGSRAAFYSENSMIIPSTSENAKLTASFAKFAISDNATLKTLAEENGIMPSYSPAYDGLDLKAKSDYFDDQNIISLFIFGDNLSYDDKYDYNYKKIKPMVIETQKDILENNLIVKDALTALSLKVNTTPLK